MSNLNYFDTFDSTNVIAEIGFNHNGDIDIQFLLKWIKKSRLLLSRNL